MQRRLAAILAADVADYSRLMGEDQTRTLDALRQLRKELFEPQVSAFRGTVVKSMGDGCDISPLCCSGHPQLALILVLGATTSVEEEEEDERHR